MLSLLFGTSRSALREACLRAVSETMQTSPGQNGLLIVPEQTKIDIERDLLMQSRQKCLMTVEVLSFRRLAWRLLGEIGQQPAHTVDALGRSMLIHKVLRDSRHELHALGALADRPGFVGQVASVLGDLKRYRIDPDQLKTSAQTATDQALKHKSLDLACVMDGYQRLMVEADLTDSEDDLTRLGDILQQLIGLSDSPWPWPWSRLSWLRNTHVWITGFGELRDFTPQEDAILSGLAALARSLTITAAADRIPVSRDLAEQGIEAFMAGRRTIWRLVSRLSGFRTQKINRPMTRRSQNIQSILRTGLPAPELIDCGSAAQSDALGLIEAPTIDDEVAWVAGTIRQLVQLEGYRYRDITLAVCNLQQYAARLRSVFRTFGIPLFLDAERSLSGTPFMRFVLGLLDTELTGWSRNALMTCLRTGLTPLNPHDIDLLENAWLARGLFREDLIFSDNRYEPSLSTVEIDRQSDETDERSDKSKTSGPINRESILELRDQVLCPIRDVLHQLRKEQQTGVRIDRLRSFLDAYQVPQRIQEWADALIESHDTDTAATLIQSWNIFNHVLDQMHQLFADTPLSLKAFRDLIATAIDTATVTVIPSAIDQVNIGDLQHSMLRETPVLFIVGASAGQLPPAPPSEGLLKDPDRQILSQITGRQMPSRLRDKVFADALMIETLMTQNTEKLYLTTQQGTASSIFDLLSRHFSDAHQVLDETPDLADPRLNAPDPVFRWLLSHEALTGQITVMQKMNELLLSAGYTRPELTAPEQKVSPEMIQALYQPPVLLSVSQLETYAACPFKQFSDRLLALRERPEWQPERTLTGVLLHGMMEQALRTICYELNQWPDDPNAFWQLWIDRDLTAAVRDWFNRTIDRYRMHRLLDDGLRASTGRRVCKTIESSLNIILQQLKDDPYQPALFEWTFDPHQHTALPIRTDPDMTVRLQGKIDRIDFYASEDCTYFRVIDYKSGQRAVDYHALYHGLSLQLPIYAAAYAQANPDTIPGDAAWFTVNRPITQMNDGLIPDLDQLIQRQLKDQKPISLRLSSDERVKVCRHAVHMAAQLSDQILHGLFAPNPVRLSSQPIPCQTCSFGSVCQFDRRIGPWRRLEKLHVDNGQDTSMTAKNTFLMLIDKQDERNGD